MDDAMFAAALQNNMIASQAAFAASLSTAASGSDREKAAYIAVYGDKAESAGWRAAARQRLLAWSRLLSVEEAKVRQLAKTSGIRKAELRLPDTALDHDAAFVRATNQVLNEMLPDTPTSAANRLRSAIADVQRVPDEYRAWLAQIRREFDACSSERQRQICAARASSSLMVNRQTWQASYAAGQASLRVNGLLPPTAAQS